MGKTLIFCTLTTLVLSLVLSLPGHSQSPQKIKSAEEAMRESMISITKQLGTTCTECHNVSNFRDNSKPSFKVGLEHMKIVEVLKANGFNGKGHPEASCYMCHRGELKGFKSTL